MANAWYNKGLEKVMNGQVDIGTHTFKAMLMFGSGASAYSFNKDTDEFVSNISSKEYTGGSYARQSVTVTVVLNTVTDRVRWAITTPTFPSISSAESAGSVVVYRDTGVDSTSPLMLYHDNGGFPITLTGADLDVDYDDADGAAYAQN